MRVLSALVLVAACGSKQSGSDDGHAHFAPVVVDSHVHLSILPVGNALLKHGVGIVFDLAAPERTLGHSTEKLEVRAAGPMLTHPNGYPLDSWGRDGYGIGCADAACVKTTIDRLVTENVAVIKIAGDDDGLDPALIPVAVEAAHAHQLKVVIHALSNAGALVGAKAGCDVLAHTPTEPLSDETIEAWRGRAVITTLAAFGAPAAVDNLRKLRAAGVTILYGTDLGNLQVDGVSKEELQLMREAGLDDSAIVDAMVTTPYKFWGLDDRSDGDTYLVLRADPRRDANTLLEPLVVYFHGPPVK
ncbi:MAG: hypothetical protein QM831_23335 [Kofleriaceae bacterium]